MKLAFAAPTSGFPFWSIALGSHASRKHFVIKLFNAAPCIARSGRGAYPSVPWALAGCPIVCSTCCQRSGMKGVHLGPILGHECGMLDASTAMTIVHFLTHPEVAIDPTIPCQKVRLSMAAAWLSG
jgi:hypothetical protein